jgi:hypothetical protein
LLTVLLQQGCITRMIATATKSLGCSGIADAGCFCTEPAFGYGLRDCGNEACGRSQAQIVISYGVGYCSCEYPKFWYTHVRDSG